MEPLVGGVVEGWEWVLSKVVVKGLLWFYCK